MLINQETKVCGPWTLKSYDDVVVTQEIIPLGNYGPSNSTIPADVKRKAMEQAKKLLKKYSEDICVTKEAGKEPDMNTYDDVQNTRRYLIHEINDLSDRTHINLKHKFNMVDDDPPSWGKELVQRILDGKYSIPEPYENENWVYPYNIRWHDPSKKKDKEGFKTAWDSFTTAEQKATDTANVLTAAEGLAALDDLREYADELVHGKKSKK